MSDKDSCALSLDTGDTQSRARILTGLYDRVDCKMPADSLLG